MDSTGIVAEMCIGDEHDFQGIEFAGGFINSNFIRRYINVFGMVDAADTDQQNTKDADRSGNRKRNTWMDPGCMENVFEDQSYDVRTQHDHQNIHKDPKKIVAGDFEDPVQGSWFFYQKSC